MIDSVTPQSSDAPVEDVLREQLAHGDIVLATIGPILGHLLANQDHSLFSDEIVARVRGMVSHIALQMLHAQGTAANTVDPDAFARALQDHLAERLMTHPPLMTHCHALALEWQLGMRLDGRNSIDPVLSPLMQALIASDDPGTANSAMTLLASQARFIQQQRRMELPIHELPGDLFHHALMIFRDGACEGAADASAEAETDLRGAYDEGASRLGLLSRLVINMGGGATAALSISHAGIAIFLSALAIASGQDRDIAAISTNDRQLARFALALRAAGLKPKDVEEQFLYIHPEVTLPESFDTLRMDRAAALLAESGRNSAG